MNKLKILGKNFLTSVFILIISMFVLSVLSYFNILNGKALIIIQMLICFLSILIGSYKQGKCSNKKGYIEGAKIGGLYLILFSIINIIFYRLFHLKNYLYYILTLIISAFGGMIGISRKKNNN